MSPWLIGVGRTRPNPAAAAEVYEKFHGHPHTEIIDDADPCIPRGDYPSLGPMLELTFKPADGGQVQVIKFRGKQRPLVLSTEAGRQLYFYGGDQDVSESLPTDACGVVELGTAKTITYLGAKPQEDYPEEIEWTHKFGEEGGEPPNLLFDSDRKRLLLRGGTYYIAGSWMRD
jgi:hypothetical protein